MKRCINFQIWINFKVSQRLGLIEFNLLIKVHVFLALNMNILNNKEIALAYVFKSNWQISHQFLCESLQLLNHSSVLSCFAVNGFSVRVTTFIS